MLFVAPAVFNAAGDTAILNVIPRSAPSSAETVRLVAAIRAAAPAIKAATGIDGRGHRPDGDHHRHLAQAG